MNIVLGFGSTEEEFEKQEMDFVHSFLQKEAELTNDFVFSDDLLVRLEHALKERAEEYRRLDGEYKNAEVYPNRYSTYYVYLTANATLLCVQFIFGHTNRKHPMSPDGWAYMQTTRYFNADYNDYGRNKP